MAICPFAIVKLIDSADPGRYHTPVRLTAHTAVSSALDLYKGKPAPNGTYANFYVNEFGQLYQYRDTSRAARADGGGNFGSISFESWDGGKEIPWNAAQVATIIKLWQWVLDVHPTVPNRIGTVDDLRGLCWHRLGCRGNFGAFDQNNILTWSGNQSGATWSTAFGKTCPHDARIKQLPGIVAAKPAKTVKEDPLMALTDKQAQTLANDMIKTKAAVGRLEIARKEDRALLDEIKALLTDRSKSVLLDKTIKSNAALGRMEQGK